MTNFIREVRYSTWLTNVIMVKKSNGKRWMRTDYIDLDRACPKDAYPLPSIDRLVDGVQVPSTKLLGRLLWIQLNLNACSRQGENDIHH